MVVVSVGRARAFMDRSGAMFDKQPVKVGPSTWAVWVTAVALAVVGVLQQGDGWLLAVSAGLVAVNNAARSFQAIYEPELFYADDADVAALVDVDDDDDELEV